MKYSFFILFLLSFFACKQDYMPDEEETDSTEEEFRQRVSVKPLEKSSAPIPIEAMGSLNSKTNLDLSFKNGGVIENIFVSESQRVKKGTVLATIESNEIDAKAKKIKERMTKANRDLKRIKKMYEDEVATLEQVEDLTTVRDLLRSDLELIQIAKEYATITAPTSGRIMEKFVEVGEIVSPGRPVFQLSTKNASDNFTMNVGVSDKDVLRLRLRDKAEVHLDAYPGKVFKAYVSEIGQVPLQGQYTYKVELTVKPNGRSLKLGFLGKATLYPRKQGPYYKIDIESLVEGYKDKANIFIVKKMDDQYVAKKKHVSPQFIEADFFTTDISQLDPSSQVITKGAAYLKDGMPIEIVDKK